MIKVKGEKNTANDKRLGKALGLSGNNIARAYGFPSAQPKKKEAEIKDAPYINAPGPAQRRNEDALPDKPDSDFDSDLDVDDDDEVMAKIRAKRIAELKQEQAVKESRKQKGQGAYSEIKEDEFLPTVTSSYNSIVHFFHQDFPRCKIIDRHLSLIARAHPECKIVKMDAEKAPFFVQKLKIMTLPTIITFVNGVAKDRIVGFEELGGRDDFKAKVLEKRLIKAKVMKKRDNDSDEDEEDEEDFLQRKFNPIREALRD